jgi:hypothetical protein
MDHRQPSQDLANLVIILGTRISDPVRQYYPDLDDHLGLFRTHYDVCWPAGSASGSFKLNSQAGTGREGGYLKLDQSMTAGLMPNVCF